MEKTNIIDKEEAKKIALEIEQLLNGVPYGLAKSIKTYAQKKVKSPGKVFAIYPKNDAEKNFLLSILNVLNIQHTLKKEIAYHDIDKLKPIIDDFSKINKLLKKIEEEYKQLKD